MNTYRKYPRIRRAVRAFMLVGWTETDRFIRRAARGDQYALGVIRAARTRLHPGKPRSVLGRSRPFHPDAGVIHSNGV